MAVSQWKAPNGRACSLLSSSPSKRRKLRSLPVPRLQLAVHSVAGSKRRSAGGTARRSVWGRRGTRCCSNCWFAFERRGGLTEKGELNLACVRLPRAADAVVAVRRHSHTLLPTQTTTKETIGPNDCSCGLANGMCLTLVDEVLLAQLQANMHIQLVLSSWKEHKVSS